MSELLGIEALRQAKVILGSQAAVARIVGVEQPSVHYILAKAEKVPAEWCIPIEKATDGQITRHQLRPDLYPQESQEAAA
jgi:DNA-binding transcriptional regulator YdaS (Cro superfamily)